MITVIDHGAGNLASLEGALEAMGFAFRRATRPEEAEGLLLLPGDGHFGAARRGLVDTGWWEALPRLVAEGQPLLGICVGLQLLAQGSEEAPELPGLGLLPGRVRRLGTNLNEEGPPGRPAPSTSPLKHPHALPGQSPASASGVKVPHMGWARTTLVKSHPAFGREAEGWLYFVHSYALDLDGATILSAEHGRPFAAVAGATSGRGRVLGFQPHPEKSGPHGRALLAGALRWLANPAEA
ncbi:MAG TPA: hypothetical protein VJ600_09085 [Holophagaceae bacterium]|nr:hypothetical protein [Holophagaceae bacterium]